MFNQLTKGLFAAVLVASGLLGATAFAAGATTPVSALTGYDVSYPQCGATLPTSTGLGIVGVNDGHPFSANPCLSGELRWAETTVSGAPAFYMNTGNPGPSYSSNWPTNQQSPRVCHGANSPACSYDFGWNTARISFTNAVNAETADGSLSAASSARVAHWWLDVETGNTWETLEPGYGKTATSKANDQQMLEGSIASLTNIGVTSIGAYSTPSQWHTITGGTDSTFPAVPVWVPGYATLSSAQVACTSPSFTGGRVAMIQYPSNGLDGDYVCGLLSSPAAASVAAAGSSTFTDQLVVSGNDGAVTYVQTTGAPALTVSASGLVTTSGALAVGSYTASGTTSDPNGDIGTFAFALVVGAITQNAPTSNSVVTTALSAFTDQLSVSHNDGAVTFAQTSGTANLTVSASGLVTPGATLAFGTYVARGSTSDTHGDAGTFTYRLQVTHPAPPPSFAAPGPIHVAGYAVAGRSVTLSVVGAGFYGRPSVASHRGTTALVTRDSGTLLSLRVTVKPGSPNGVFTFTITLANGQSRRVKYNQR